ncbi:hypothetical protein UA45_05665, partial [Morganella morganii]
MNTLQQVLHQSLQAVQAGYSPGLRQSGQLLNFAPSQISQLRDDLHVPGTGSRCPLLSPAQQPGLSGEKNE